MMDLQMQTEMPQRAIQEDRGDRAREDLTEEQFLKDLYIFMKKRDTPIERIPHLGFKQIDLYMMFKTVKDFGGYHQVTAQQLWKQVYNILGGNPRSTSAATCTRRHYEKLMLPYECHIKGLRLSAVQQPRNYHYVGQRKPEEDCPNPAKRRPEMYPLQNAQRIMPGHHAGLFPLSPSYHKFYYHPYSPLPHSLMPSPRLPAPPAPPPQSYLTCIPPIAGSIEYLPPNSTDRSKDPLEHLRYLAKQYESSVGLSEPLNLSVKASASNIAANPTSSFAPPLSNKNPKFLNKPSPLYTSQNANVKSDAESDVATPSVFKNVKDSSSCNFQAVSAEADQHNEETKDKQGKPGVRCMNECLTTTGDNEGRMEIEIPLSVFNSWLHMYGPQATMHGSRQLLNQEDNRTKSSVAEPTAANFTFEIKQSKVDGGNLQHLPGQSCSSERDPPGHYQRGNRSLGCGILKNAASRDVYPLNDMPKPVNLKSVPTVCWDLTGSSEPTLPKQVKVATSPPTVPQDLRTPKAYAAEEPVQRHPGSEVLQLNPTSTLQLTPEEVMKLRKIIHNSA